MFLESLVAAYGVRSTQIKQMASTCMFYTQKVRAAPLLTELLNLSLAWGNFQQSYRTRWFHPFIQLPSIIFCINHSYTTRIVENLNGLLHEAIDKEIKEKIMLLENVVKPIIFRKQMFPFLVPYV